MGALPNLAGLLLDLDGCVYVGNELIDGAVQAITALRERGVPYRFTTNTTTISRASLLGKLRAMGLPVELDDLVTAPSAAVRYLAAKGAPRCHLLLSDDLEPEFAQFEPPRENEKADAIVIGDIGDRWNYAMLDRAFKYLVDGAELIALHKGRYWERASGLGLDIGAFVAGLEYSSGCEATIIGKPSPDFFRLAVADLGLPPETVAMVGDDVDSDVGGAQRAGLRGVLVKTGKYRDAFVARSPVTPDAVLDSIADVERLLDG